MANSTEVHALGKENMVANVLQKNTEMYYAGCTANETEAVPPQSSFVTTACGAKKIL